MPGRTSDVSVSTFKPLSLDEILMVPLYKQKKHEMAQNALDELDQLGANSLDIDSDYVSGQQANIRKEAGGISDQLISQGVDSGLINRLRSLRRKKTKEFSLEGGVGKATQAYDSMVANRKLINARKDLTAEQKIAGINQSIKNYTGVQEGDSYQDYIGAAYVDFMKRGVELAKQMTPDEVAKRLNMKKVNNGYSDGEYIHKTLTAKHIQEAVRQQLAAEPGTMNYLREMESLGLGNAGNMLDEAAIGAGNIGKVDIKKNYKYWNDPSNVVDDENGIPDTSQNWRSRNFNGGMSAFNLTYDLDGDYGKNPLNFKSSTKGDGYIDEIPEFTGTKKQRKNTAVMPFGTAPQMQEVNTSEYNEYLDRFAEGLKVKEKLDKLRGDNPLAFEGKTDKFIYDAYQNAKINSTQKMSQVFKPVNAESSFYKYAELTKGTSSEDGDYSTRGMKILGETNNGTKLTYKEVANALGYDSLQEFNEAMKSSSTMGTVPTDIDYPFATAFSVAKKDGSRKTILVETDDSLEQFHKHPSNMIKNLMNGVVAQYAGQSTFLMDPSDKNSVTPVHNYYVNTLNPRFNAYENVLVQSVHKFTEEDLKYLKLHRNPNGTLSGSAYLGKEQILYNHVTLRTHQQVLDDAVNNILGTYDNQATTKSVKERIPQLLKK